jgi:curved DNA-binding protein
MKKLYSTLEVNENASEQEIKKAYRKLAKQYHPDKCKTPECEEKFKEISSAYEVLSDKNKKSQYDRYGDSMFEEGHNRSQYTNMGDMEDIISQMFGQGFRGFNQHINLDTHIRVRVPLETAYKGGTINVKGIKVKVPPKIKNGSSLRVKGKGKTYNNMTGDMIIQLLIQSPVGYELVQDDIYTEININLIDLMFGVSKEIEVFGDKTTIKIPTNSKPHQKLRIRNKGLGNGNLIVVLNLVLPDSKNITPEERNILENKFKI